MSQQLDGEQYKMICSGAWACKHTYILPSLLWDCVHIVLGKVSSA